VAAACSGGVMKWRMITRERIALVVNTHTTTH
jgi:hypothetical protein